jgi:hypothetical protein
VAGARQPHGPLIRTERQIPIPWPGGEFAEACRLFQTGIDGNAVDKAAQLENPAYLRLRRGQQQVAADLPDPALRSGERGRATAVDECQASQVDDGLPAAGRRGRERGGHGYGICRIEFTAQRDDDVIIAFPDIQIHTEHGSAFLHLHLQQGEVLAWRMNHYLWAPPYA